MFIKTIEAKNLRSFEYLKLDLSRNINLITGPNNSGKSTIIKCLYKLQDTRSLDANDIRVAKDSFQALIQISGISDDEKKLFNNEKRIILPKTDPAYILLESNSNGHQRESIEQHGYTDIHFSLENLDTHISSGQASFINFLSFPNSEDKNNFIYPFFAKRKTNYYSAQGGRQTTYSILDNFQNLPAKIQKVISQSFTKNEFDKLCEDILGFTIGIIPGDGTENKIGIYPRSGNPIPLESMGDGVANIIGLITILLTENEKLFLIEELENDIHPLALKKLLSLIINKSEQNQFVISTHSNIVLKHLGSIETSKIFYTEVEHNKKENVSFSTVSEISTSEERLKSLELLGYDLFDYDLYNSYLILEESSAEKIIRDFIIPTFFPELKHKLRTIAGQGVDDILPKFNDLHRLFMYIHKAEIYKNKAWVIADGDNPGKTAIDKLKEKFKNWDHSHFINFSKPYFELYYPTKFQPDVESIMKMQNSKEKQKRKSNLLNNVFTWIEENQEDAKNEFSECAKEVLDTIRLINQKIK